MGAHWKKPKRYALAWNISGARICQSKVSGPDFSLLTACYPYLARRLLTDDNPRAQEALGAEMIYDGSGASRIDLERLI